MYLSRRALLRGGGAAAAAAAFAGPFSGYVAHAERRFPRIAGYGPIGPVADLRDGKVRLDLPAGFQYRSFHHAGELLTDGTEIPGRHDGMAAFARPDGTTVLVRNHEINGSSNRAELDIRLGSAPGYDAKTKGGTVTVVVDGEGNVGDSWVSLSGTQMNCSGGATPWGTWITCEETVNGGDVGPDFTGAPNTGLQKHGYLFEVPTDGVSSLVPIKAAGRFAHEAAAVAPHGKAVYLTEDSFLTPSGFYKYVPDDKAKVAGRLPTTGTLWMLKVRGVTNADLSGDQAGKSYPVEWVQIDDPDPDMTGKTNDQAIRMVGDQGRAKGAAIFSRLEGAKWSSGRIWFTSTQGGLASDPIGGNSYDLVRDGFGRGRGQVWSYHPGRERLECVYQSPASAQLDLPDNVTASDNGTLVLCEDGAGDNFLRGLTMQGELFTFARNADPVQFGQEFAGATWSPDFQTLYVNIQSSPTSTGTRKGGYSIAIWGPWETGPF